MKNFIAQLDLKNVTRGTIYRTVAMLLVVVNYGLQLFGVDAAIDTNIAVDVVTFVVSVIVFLQVYWQNNSWTKAAQEADKRYEELKKGE